MRVLIVDDHLKVREGLKALLDFLPEVEIVGEAANGKEALLIVAEQDPDLVLIDIQMPVMDGLTAIKKIKARWPEVGVIAMTVYPAFRAKALEAGADTFILKGCPVEKIKNTILGCKRVSKHH
jgi:YesN/AraC family two-component response regulator